MIASDFKEQMILGGANFDIDRARTTGADVQDDDYLGNINFRGYHTAAYVYAARIRAMVDGTPGSSDMPGRLEFLTTPDGSDTPSIRGAVFSDGSWRFGDGAWTNYIQISSSGAITFAGTASINLPADTVVSADIADDVVTHGDILDSDQADTKCVYIENPTADDDLNSIWANKTANDFLITEIWAESDQTVNFDLQVDDGTPADVNGTDISPAAGEAEDTTLSGDTTLAAGEELDLAITSVSDTPTWVSICWTGNWVD